MTQSAIEAAQPAQQEWNRIRGAYAELQHQVREEKDDKPRRYAAISILLAGFEAFAESYGAYRMLTDDLLAANPLMRKAAESFAANGREDGLSALQNWGQGANEPGTNRQGHQREKGNRRCANRGRLRFGDRLVKKGERDEGTLLELRQHVAFLTIRCFNTAGGSKSNLKPAILQRACLCSRGYPNWSKSLVEKFLQHFSEFVADWTDLWTIKVGGGNLPYWEWASRRFCRVDLIFVRSQSLATFFVYKLCFLLNQPSSIVIEKEFERLFCTDWVA